MEEKIFEEMKYFISYPEGFCEDKKYPLVIFLHGRGARTESTEKLRNYGCLPHIQHYQNKKGFILIAPHCKSGNWSEWVAVLIRLVEKLRDISYIDETRIYLTGNSMGGYGTWELAGLRPHFFAAAMPICGGGLPGMANELIDLPIRTFHGLCDKTVDPLESLEMAKAVNRFGGHAELILFPQLPHNCWDEVYTDERNYDWLFSFTTERDKDLARKLSRD